MLKTLAQMMQELCSDTGRKKVDKVRPFRLTLLTAQMEETLPNNEL